MNLKKIVFYELDIKFKIEKFKQQNNMTEFILTSWRKIEPSTGRNKSSRRGKEENSCGIRTNEVRRITGSDRQT